ncbi:ion transporter [Aestuariibacter salexigens]|uniref:ion transporter n=1 Tax=Aestuariibacter salexigens TaxID=226010 RepID=UPI00047DF936|nr:ion transporter [Aestuariibacter salexigens]
MSGFRQRTAELLQVHKRGDHVSHLFDWFLISLIILNIIAVMLETVDSIHNKYHLQLIWFELFSVAIFTIEYIARVWSCIELEESDEPPWKQRMQYMLTPMALIDLAAFLPFYLGFFINADLRTLRIFRLLRLIKLGRYSSAMQLLFQVFQREYRVLVAALTVLLMIMVLASSGIYLIEHDVQPDKFGSIPAAMWWAMATLTTVGYGDVTPITPLGKFFGGVITLMGVAMFALPAGILASSFSDQLSRRRNKFSQKVREALANGHLDFHDLRELEKWRLQLGLEHDDAKILMDAIKAGTQSQEPTQCPHCGKSLHEK